MYRPQRFAETDGILLQRLMRENPLATLVRAGEGGAAADHVPLLLRATREGLVLRGHCARANPLAQESGAVVLAIFHGPDAYVSPSWYPGKDGDPRVVPTWNYAVVHAHGALRTVDDRDWLRDHIEALTAAHEADFPMPWRVADAPPDFVARLVEAIVGIEIAVMRMEGKFKLGQNRSAADRQGVIAGLRASGRCKGASMAQWMDAGAMPAPDAA